METEPHKFRCPEHDNSDYLTTAVRTKVSDAEIILTDEAPADAFNLFGRHDGGSFKVMVNCPGAGPDAQPHPLVFEGTWSE